MLEDLILYFVYKTKGFITKTQLVKFLYLADLYSVKWTSKQLTDLDWYYYNYGPWDDGIDFALNKLEGKIVQVKDRDTILIQMGANFPGVDSFKLSESLQLMLENIRREWAGGDSDKIKNLLSYVYSTAPMIEAQSKYNREDKARLNLQLEREKLIEELGV